MELITLRIDKWLWAVRLHKTRSLATEACKAGHVQLDGHKVKPARNVKLNEIITVRSGPITKKVRVTGLIERRVGASLVNQYYEDLTSPEEYEKLKDEKRQPFFANPKGLGRPTKKDRRTMGRILGRPKDMS